jgi:hypothetical protein
MHKEFGLATPSVGIWLRMMHMNLILAAALGGMLHGIFLIRFAVLKCNLLKPNLVQMAQFVTLI